MSDLRLHFMERTEQYSRGIFFLKKKFELVNWVIDPKFPRAMKVGMKTLLIMNFILSHFPNWWFIYIIVGVLCQRLLIFCVTAVLTLLVQYYFINNLPLHTIEISVLGHIQRKRKYSFFQTPFPSPYKSIKRHISALRSRTFSFF